MQQPSDRKEQERMEDVLSLPVDPPAHGGQTGVVTFASAVSASAASTSGRERRRGWRLPSAASMVRRRSSFKAGQPGIQSNLPVQLEALPSATSMGVHPGISATLRFLVRDIQCLDSSKPLGLRLAAASHTRQALSKYSHQQAALALLWSAVRPLLWEPNVAARNAAFDIACDMCSHHFYALGALRGEFLYMVVLAHRGDEPQRQRLLRRATLDGGSMDPYVDAVAAAMAGFSDMDTDHKAFCTMVARMCHKGARCLPPKVVGMIARRLCHITRRALRRETALCRRAIEAFEALLSSKALQSSSLPRVVDALTRLVNVECKATWGVFRRLLADAHSAPIVLQLLLDTLLGDNPVSKSTPTTSDEHTSVLGAPPRVPSLELDAEVLLPARPSALSRVAGVSSSALRGAVYLLSMARYSYSAQPSAQQIPLLTVAAALRCTSESDATAVLQEVLLSLARMVKQFGPHLIAEWTHLAAVLHKAARWCHQRRKLQHATMQAMQAATHLSRAGTAGRIARPSAAATGVGMATHIASRPNLPAGLSSEPVTTALRGFAQSIVGLFLSGQYHGSDAIAASMWEALPELMPEHSQLLQLQSCVSRMAHAALCSGVSLQPATDDATWWSDVTHIVRQFYIEQAFPTVRACAVHGLWLLWRATRHLHGKDVSTGGGGGTAPSKATKLADVFIQQGFKPLLVSCYAEVDPSVRMLLMAVAVNVSQACSADHEQSPIDLQLAVLCNSQHMAVVKSSDSETVAAWSRAWHTRAVLPASELRAGFLDAVCILSLVRVSHLEAATSVVASEREQALQALQLLSDAVESENGQHVIQLQSEGLQGAVERLPLDIIAASRSSVAQLATAGLMHRLLTATRSNSSETVRLVGEVLQGLAMHHSFPGTRFHALNALLRVLELSDMQVVQQLMPFVPSAAAHVAATTEASVIQEHFTVSKDTGACISDLQESIKQHTWEVCMAGLRSCVKQVAAREKASVAKGSGSPLLKSLSDFLAPPSILSPSAAEFLVALRVVCSDSVCAPAGPRQSMAVLELLSITVDLAAVILQCSDPWTDLSFGSPPVKCAFAPLDVLSSLVSFVSSFEGGLYDDQQSKHISQLLNTLCIDCSDILREACLCAVPTADHELQPASAVCSAIQDLANAVAVLGSSRVQSSTKLHVHPAPLMQALLLCVSSAFSGLQRPADATHEQQLCVLAVCNCAGGVAYSMLLTGRTQDDSVIALAQQISVMCLTTVCKLASGEQWQVEDPPAVLERRAGFRPNKMPQAVLHGEFYEEEAITDHKVYLHALQVAYRCFVEAHLAASRFRRKVLHQQLNPLLLSISKSLRGNLATTLSLQPSSSSALAVERCLAILSACHGLMGVMHQYHSPKLGFVELSDEGGAKLHTLAPGEDQYWNAPSRQGFHLRVLYGAPLELSPATHPRHFPQCDAQPHKLDLLNAGRLVKAMHWETQNVPELSTATALLSALFKLPPTDKSASSLEASADADTEWAFVHSGRLYSVRVGCGLQVSIRCRQSTVCEEWHGSLAELLEAAPDTSATYSTVGEEEPQAALTTEDAYGFPSPDRMERSGSLATITATSFSQSAIQRPHLLQAAERDISVLHFTVRDQDITDHDGGQWDAASDSSAAGSDEGGSFGFFADGGGTGLGDYAPSAQLQLLQSDTQPVPTAQAKTFTSAVVRVGRGQSFTSDEVNTHMGGRAHSQRSGDSAGMALSLSPVSTQITAVGDSEGDASPEVRDIMGMVAGAVQGTAAAPQTSGGSLGSGGAPILAKSLSPAAKPMRVMMPLKVKDLYQSQNPESDSVVVFGVGASASASSPRRRHTAWEKVRQHSPRGHAPAARTLSSSRAADDLDGVALRRSISARESLNAVRQRLKRIESSDGLAVAATSSDADGGNTPSAQSTTEEERFMSPHELQSSLGVGAPGSPPASPAAVAAASPGLAAAPLGGRQGDAATLQHSDGDELNPGLGMHGSPVLGALSARGRSPSREAASLGGINTGMPIRKWSLASAASSTSERYGSLRSRNGSEDVVVDAVQARQQARQQAMHQRTEQLLAWACASAEGSSAAHAVKVRSIQAAFEADVGDLPAMEPATPRFEDPECLAAISSASLIWAYLSWGASPPDIVPSPESVARTLQRKAIIPIKCEQRLLQRSLAVLDRTLAADTCKVGVVFVASGQHTEREVLLNQRTHTSAAFQDFTNKLGWLVDTQACPAWLFLGGLSRTGSSDGEQSLVWLSRSGALQMAFHVAPWIRSANISVNCPDEEEVFVRVKRHIGNDFVTVAFVEEGGEANLSTFTGHFSNVLILVQPRTARTVHDTAEQLPKSYLVTVLSKQELSCTLPVSCCSGFLSRRMEQQMQSAVGMASLGATGLQRALSTVCVDGCAGHSVVPPNSSSAPASAAGEANDISGVRADPRSLFSRVDGLRGDSGRKSRSSNSPLRNKSACSSTDGHSHCHSHGQAAGLRGQVAQIAARGRLLDCGQACVQAEQVGPFVRQLAIQCDIAVRASVPTALHASPLSGPASRFEQYQRVLTRLMGSS